MILNLELIQPLLNNMNLTTKDLADLQKQAEPFILKAGEQIKNAWYNIKEIRYKDKRDLATNVDINVEEYLREKLSRILPEAGFYVEEGINESKKTYNWTIDPIDGTKYYAGLFPIFVTQVALLKNNKSVIGLIYNPISNQLFSASKDNGTYFNCKKVVLDSKITIEKSIVEVDFGGKDNEINKKVTLLNKLIKSFYRVRMFGGTIVSYIITGAIDAYILLNKNNKLVDIAPNIIILNEAGVKTDFISIGGYKEIFVAANELLYENILKLFHN